MKYGETADFAFELKVKGTGKPYRVDCRNGEAEKIGCDRHEEGRTVQDVCLAPGEAAMFVVDTNAQEELHAVRTTAHGLGIVTNEVYYETKKTRLAAGETELKPWKDIEGVGPEVSGVGYYTVMVNIPEVWDESQGAVLKIGSTNGHSAAVYVNGVKAKAFDFDALAVDISDLLHSGENEIRVEVASSLNNRLKARGYYAKGNEFSKQLADNANNAMENSPEDAQPGDLAMMFNIQAVIRDYGITGDVRLIRYIRREI